MNNSNWAIIPGFSLGTGAAIAKALVEESKLNILGLHRGNNKGDAESVREFAESNGQECWIVEGDASQPEFIDDVVKEFKSRYGEQKVSSFIHSIANASFGGFLGDKEKQIHPKQIRKSFEGMAHSFVYWIQSIFNHNILAPKCQFLGLTNPIVDSLVDGTGVISASKKALEVYVRHLALELGPYGHNVNLIQFGLVETNAIMMAFDDDWEGVKQRFSAVTPAGRIVTVEEVGKLTAMIVNSKFEMLNGATLDFTGGQAQTLLTHVFRPEKLLKTLIASDLISNEVKKVA